MNCLWSVDIKNTLQLLMASNISHFIPNEIVSCNLKKNGFDMVIAGFCKAGAFVLKGIFVIY